MIININIVSIKKLVISINSVFDSEPKKRYDIRFAYYPTKNRTELAQNRTKLLI